MANDMGLVGGRSGGMAYQLLKDLLARRFTEEQAALKQENANRAYGLDSERVGLEGARLKEDTRQFNETGARSDRQFAEGAPLRTAQTANYNESVTDSQYKRSPGKRSADQADALALEAARGENARRVAGIRQVPRYQLSDGTDATTHQPVKLRFNPETGEMSQVRIVGGNIRVGKPNKLTAQQQTEVGNYDAVVKEGKVILDALKRSGLDKENNPISPRARSFIAQKLKVDTNDPIVDKVIQNVGYLQTVALRSAAGNQRLTNELMHTFKPHIGDTESSGARLATILPELLRQIGDRRTNTYRLAGVDDPNDAAAGDSGGDSAARAAALIQKYGG